ncbi:MAG: 4-hydroxy-3-methylbut-2-enyl diphosphate reductase [Porticoccaceae bacterium]|nr:4-hydroxy-3-methylbut-2-enyl diphosphate reductase [Porticoccaceae bacterium]
MKIKLANPRGFCAGVDRAIAIVEQALKSFGAPLYVRHEVVHNKAVVDDMRSRGVVFIEDLKDVPDNVPLIFSAHGVPEKVRREAHERSLQVFDATCPLVTKVHFEVHKYSRDGAECILIGHSGHPEVEGTIGQYDATAGGSIYLVESEQQASKIKVRDPNKLAYVTQTTLSVDDTARVIGVLRNRFPNIIGPRKDDICYATQNRQDAVRQLAIETDVVLVVGSATSSNSNRLKDLAERCGCRAYLIDNAAEILPDWLDNVRSIGISAGASAPEFLVTEVVNKLISLGGEPPKELNGIIENITFSLPKELRSHLL